MDGNFVPNITMGTDIIKAIKKNTSVPLDVHLMIENPEKHIDSFIEIGAKNISIHIETTNHPERLLRYIKSHGVNAGIAFNPASDINCLQYLGNAFDLVLIMTVNPGFSAQKLIPAVFNKIKKLQELQKKEKFLIEVDGGINSNNIKEIYQMGVNIAVAGNAIFGTKDPSKALLKLQEEVL